MQPILMAKAEELSISGIFPQLLQVEGRCQGQQCAKGLLSTGTWGWGVTLLLLPSWKVKTRNLKATDRLQCTMLQRYFLNHIRFK